MMIVCICTYNDDNDDDDDDDNLQPVSGRYFFRESQAQLMILMCPNSGNKNES